MVEKKCEGFRLGCSCSLCSHKDHSLVQFQLHEIITFFRKKKLLNYEGFYLSYFQGHSYSLINIIFSLYELLGKKGDYLFTWSEIIGPLGILCLTSDAEDHLCSLILMSLGFFIKKRCYFIEKETLMFIIECVGHIQQIFLEENSSDTLIIEILNVFDDLIEHPLFYTLPDVYIQNILMWTMSIILSPKAKDLIASRANVIFETFSRSCIELFYKACFQNEHAVDQVPMHQMQEDLFDEKGIKYIVCLVTLYSSYLMLPSNQTTISLVRTTFQRLSNASKEANSVISQVLRAYPGWKKSNVAVLAKKSGIYSLENSNESLKSDLFGIDGSFYFSNGLTFSTSHVHPFSSRPSHSMINPSQTDGGKKCANENNLVFLPFIQIDLSTRTYSSNRVALGLRILLMLIIDLYPCLAFYSYCHSIRNLIGNVVVPSIFTLSFQDISLEIFSHILQITQIIFENLNHPFPHECLWLFDHIFLRPLSLTMKDAQVILQDLNGSLSNTSDSDSLLKLSSNVLDSPISFPIFVNKTLSSMGTTMAKKNFQHQELILQSLIGILQNPRFLSIFFLYGELSLHQPAILEPLLISLVHQSLIGGLSVLLSPDSEASSNSLLISSDKETSSQKKVADEVIQNSRILTLFPFLAKCIWYSPFKSFGSVVSSEKDGILQVNHKIPPKRDNSSTNSTDHHTGSTLSLPLVFLYAWLAFLNGIESLYVSEYSSISLMNAPVKLALHTHSNSIESFDLAGAADIDQFLDKPNSFDYFLFQHAQRSCLWSFAQRFNHESSLSKVIALLGKSVCDFLSSHDFHETYSYLKKIISPNIDLDDISNPKSKFKDLLQWPCSTNGFDVGRFLGRHKGFFFPKVLGKLLSTRGKASSESSIPSSKQAPVVDLSQENAPSGEMEHNFDIDSTETSIIGTEAFHHMVFKGFLSTYSFEGLGLIDTLRLVFWDVLVPGEAQIIDRFMEFISRKWFSENSHLSKNTNPFHSKDGVFVFSFSLMLLNTDHHCGKLLQSMSLSSFILNNKGINDGEDLPEDYVSGAFFDITSRPFATDNSRYRPHVERVSRESDLLLCPESFSIDNYLGHPVSDSTRMEVTKEDRDVCQLSPLVLNRDLTYEIAGEGKVSKISIPSNDIYAYLSKQFYQPSLEILFYIVRSSISHLPEVTSIEMGVHSQSLTEIFHEIITTHPIEWETFCKIMEYFLHFSHMATDRREIHFVENLMTYMLGIYSYGRHTSFEAYHDTENSSYKPLFDFFKFCGSTVYGQIWLRCLFEILYRDSNFWNEEIWSEIIRMVIFPLFWCGGFEDDDTMKRSMSWPCFSSFSPKSSSLLDFFGLHSTNEKITQNYCEKNSILSPITSLEEENASSNTRATAPSALESPLKHMHSLSGSSVQEVSLPLLSNPEFLTPYIINQQLSLSLSQSPQIPDSTNGKRWIRQWFSAGVTANESKVDEKIILWYYECKKELHKATPSMRTLLLWSRSVLNDTGFLMFITTLCKVSLETPMFPQKIWDQATLDTGLQTFFDSIGTISKGSKIASFSFSIQFLFEFLYWNAERAGIILEVVEEWTKTLLWRIFSVSFNQPGMLSGNESPEGIQDDHVAKHIIAFFCFNIQRLSKVSSGYLLQISMLKVLKLVISDESLSLSYPRVEYFYNIWSDVFKILIESWLSSKSDFYSSNNIEQIISISLDILEFLFSLFSSRKRALNRLSQSIHQLSEDFSSIMLKHEFHYNESEFEAAKEMLVSNEIKEFCFVLLTQRLLKFIVKFSMRFGMHHDVKAVENEQGDTKEESLVLQQVENAHDNIKKTVHHLCKLIILRHGQLIQNTNDVESDSIWSFLWLMTIAVHIYTLICSSEFRSMQENFLLLEVNICHPNVLKLISPFVASQVINHIFKPFLEWMCDGENIESLPQSLVDDSGRMLDQRFLVLHMTIPNNATYALFVPKGNMIPIVDYSNKVGESLESITINKPEWKGESGSAFEELYLRLILLSVKVLLSYVEGKLVNFPNWIDFWEFLLAKALVFISKSSSDSINNSDNVEENIYADLGGEKKCSLIRESLFEIIRNAAQVLFFSLKSSEDHIQNEQYTSFIQRTESYISILNLEHIIIN